MSHANPADPNPNSFFAAQKQAGPQRRDHRSPVYQQAQSKANAEKNSTAMELSMVNAEPKYPLNGLTIKTLGQYMDHTFAFRIISGDFAHKFTPGRTENNMVIDVHLNGKFSKNNTWFDIATMIEPAGRVSHKADAKGTARGSGIALEIGGTGTGENTGHQTIQVGDWVMMQPQRMSDDDWVGVKHKQVLAVSDMLSRKGSYAKGAIRISTDRYEPEMCAEQYWHHIRSFCDIRRRHEDTTCAAKLRLTNDLFHTTSSMNSKTHTNQDYIENMSAELLRSYLQFAFKFMHHLAARADQNNNDPEWAEWNRLHTINLTNPADARDFAQNLGIIPGGPMGNSQLSKQVLNSFYRDLMHRPENGDSRPLFYFHAGLQNRNADIEHIEKHTDHFHHNGLKVLMTADREFKRRIFCKALSPAAPGQDFDYIMVNAV